MHSKNKGGEEEKTRVNKNMSVQKTKAPENTLFGDFFLSRAYERIENKKELPNEPLTTVLAASLVHQERLSTATAKDCFSSRHTYQVSKLK